LISDSSLSWKKHIDSLTPKLNKSCFVIGAIKLFLSLESLKMIYFSYVHSIITYGIISWGNPSHTNNLFNIPKRIIRVMTNSINRDSGQELFKSWSILPLQSQYILLSSIFVVMNKSLFTINSEMYSIDTRHGIDLHFPHSNLTLFLKGVYYSGIKIFNHLPLVIQSLSHNLKQFKAALMKFLTSKPFYSIKEFLNFKLYRN
jgi:hypothetical protein